MDTFDDIRKFVGTRDKKFIINHSQKLGKGMLMSVENIKYGKASSKSDLLMIASAGLLALVAVVGGSVIFIKHIASKRKL